METLKNQIKSLSDSRKYTRWVINGLIAVGVIRLTFVFANVDWNAPEYKIAGSIILGAIMAVLIEGSVKLFSNSVVSMRLAFAPKRGRKASKSISPEDIIKAKKFKLKVVIFASGFANLYHAVTDFTGGSFDFTKLNPGQIALAVLFSALIPYVVYALLVDSAETGVVLDSLVKERTATRKSLERKIDSSKGKKKKKLIAQLNALEV